jgi:hypothetical protein
VIAEQAQRESEWDRRNGSGSGAIHKVTPAKDTGIDDEEGYKIVLGAADILGPALLLLR